MWTDRQTLHYIPASLRYAVDNKKNQSENSVNMDDIVGSTCTTGQHPEEGLVWWEQRSTQRRKLRPILNQSKPITH